MNYNQYLGQTVLNKWVIDEYIGSGQSGIVYKAHDNAGQVVAVKIINVPNDQQIKECEIAYGGDAEQMESLFEQIANRYVAEVESLKKLSNTSDTSGNNIIRYIDHTASTHGMQWEIIIVMEFMNTLKSYYTSHPLTTASAIKLGIDIAAGLERCHSQSVIHRDIKDDNIFADDNGNFKIGDFGVANVYTATRASTKVGTPYYMAPEIQNGADYKADVDTYSLGIVLYRLFNYSRFPFVPAANVKPRLDMTDNEEAFKKRMSGAPMPPPAMCPPAVAEVILKACAYNPADRYASVHDFKMALIHAGNTLTPEEAAAVLPSTTYKYVGPDAGQNQKSEFKFVNPSTPTAPPTPPQAPPVVDTSVLGNNYQDKGFDYINDPGKTVSVFDQPGNNTNDPDRTVAAFGQSGFNDPNATVGADVIGGGNGGSNLAETQVSGNMNRPAGGQSADAQIEAGMKTTDIFSSLIDGGNYKLANEYMRIVNERDASRSEKNKSVRRNKTLKIGVAVVAVLAAAAIACGVLLWPQTYSYDGNSDDNYNLYRYQFGKPVEEITNKDTGESIPASYVKYDDKWIYFSLHDKPFADDGDHKMYKVKKDGSNMTLLSEDHCEYLILYNDYIYYLNQSDNNALCRIKTDGSNKEVLLNEDFITSLSMEDNSGKIHATFKNGESRILDINGVEILIEQFKEGAQK